MADFNPIDYTILIVDDLPKNIQLLANVLKDNQYNIEFVTNGLKAIEWVNKKTFDLILLDVMMPEINGFETCKRIRNNQKFNDIPIIFLTAKTDHESLIEGFKAGGQDYITKPFDSSELLARVKTHLELRSSKLKLNDINKWLESKVMERTREIEESNNKLKILNQDLIDNDAVKNEFLSIISHEIRTPLNAIMGFVDLMKVDVKDEKILPWFLHIDNALKRLEKFSIQALLFTELRTKHRYADKSIILLSSFLENILSDIKDDKNLHLKYCCKPENLNIYADENLLSICMQNILENAVQYNSENGEIEVLIEQKIGGVKIEVKDTGIGFSKKASENIFKAFTTGQSLTDNNIGIDLALVKLIMDAHEGEIKIRKRKIQGTSVSLFFPTVIDE